jgi:hypothetical protein
VAELDKELREIEGEHTLELRIRSLILRSFGTWQEFKRILEASFSRLSASVGVLIGRVDVNTENIDILTREIEALKPKVFKADVTIESFGSSGSGSLKIIKNGDTCCTFLTITINDSGPSIILYVRHLIERGLNLTVAEEIPRWVVRDQQIARGYNRVRAEVGVIGTRESGGDGWLCARLKVRSSDPSKIINMTINDSKHNSDADLGGQVFDLSGVSSIDN